ncbi:hypothetical protein [Comamonas sp. NLF-1-9]|uniref:hypothetical protein n=1 Tax=Comamonas sp. NLF-1-9 TaxID=2853163 RepID=UPI001C454458|nr:hypothetical protein [Comamonas sp. NLF-1-9]QXL84114.1 hypothetical protein KUD94_12870 [Comamonas sp. NLF-1-9]
MTAARWKHLRPTSLVHALRLCKEYAQARRNLSVERIADRMGASHDALYKWLATGRMPLVLLPAYEHTCGAHYASDFLAATAGRMAIPLPLGRKVEGVDLLAVNASWAQALQLLTRFYTTPADADPEATLAALRQHLEQVAYHHANVAAFDQPHLEFEE